MTIEEKKQAIEKYCDSKSLCTSGQKWPCPLYETKYCCDSCTDKEIEEAFKLVSAMEDYNGQKETDNDDISAMVKDILDDKPTDNVNHPSHYTQGGMECIDEMLLIFGKEAVKNFCICNAWKYRKRAMFKNGQEDIDKSDWYINKYKELTADAAF